MSTCRNTMNRQTLLLAVIWFIVAVSAACTIQSESGHSEIGVSPTVVDTLLNSERIQMKFGSYGVEVLYSDSTTRITSLYSSEGDKNVTRTFAVVMYPSVVYSALFLEHQAILNGGSIGQVFKESGWTIEKKSIYFGQISPSEQYSDIYEMMGSIDPVVLAMYMYTFSVKKDGSNFEYATIAEVYHPQYLTYGDINRIYTTVSDGTVTESVLEEKLNSIRRFMSLDMLLVEPSGQ